MKRLSKLNASDALEETIELFIDQQLKSLGAQHIDMEDIRDDVAMLSFYTEISNKIEDEVSRIIKSKM